MRQYRGLTRDGKWVYGWYMEHPFSDNPAMNVSVIVQDERPYEVIPETVGQQIGLKDKNGKEIYEGDILKSTATKVKTPRIKICEWEGIGFDPFVADCEHSGDGWHWEIIGDIHTTPKLLENKND